ncbi:hypothetical protein M3Y97_00752800 [Aphelenchoides bicaudatus]|nr:hypothetical protein M3Y97_00752800 [Aphelenchoides bicaudatus]
MIIQRGPRRSITATIAANEEEKNEDEQTDDGLRRNRRASTVALNKSSRLAVVSALSLVSATSSSAKTYSSIRSSIIKMTPETMKCKLYCRGTNCRYCTWRPWPKEQQAIEGLYSSWITPNILAMARPTTEAIEKFDIIKQFKEQGISAVFNLQMPDEHSFCGPKLLPSGFSYDPETFMKNDIYYYNFAIPDFQFCSLDVVLDIIKVMNFSLKEGGKIAVHCHAGLGRTGSIIACHMVLSTGMSAEDALFKVRKARAGSVQSPVQVAIVEQSEDLLEKNARILPWISGESLSTYFCMANAFLPNEEARIYSHYLKFAIVFSVYVFEADGVSFKQTPNESHNVHSCSFGEIVVKWKNLFSHQGRSKNRYLINNLAQIAGFPYNKDEDVIRKFQSIHVAEMTKALDELDVCQLLKLLHAYMTIFKKPLASRKVLISWLELYSLESLEDKSDGSPKPKTAYKEWHCLIFYLFNVFSFLTNENYDTVTELICYWLIADVQTDVKKAVHDHLRGLFARNLKQQEEQAKQMHMAKKK